MENIDKLAIALNKAQKEMKGAVKDTVNNFFKSKYADLGSVWEACHEALNSNGLSVVQSGSWKDGHFFLTTTLIHTSGQTLSGEYLIKPTKDDPQAYGSAWTYGRRYSLAAMVGVISEDDDAEGATSHDTIPTVTRAPATRQAPSESPATVDTITFIPKDVSTRTGEGPRGKYTAYNILSPDGKSYSTLKETEGQIAIHARDNNKQIVMGFKKNGKYLNVVKLMLSDSQPDPEPKDDDVPF